MNSVALLAVVGSVMLLLACHPFTTYPLSLWLIARIRPRAAAPVAPRRTLTCAICVCAYNEERVIEAKVRNLLELMDRDPCLEVLFYVDAATDRTADILAGYRDRLAVHVATERRGKTHGMNLLASMARTDILIFSDANVMLDADCVRDFRRHFENPEVGCVTGNLVYTNAADSAAAESGSLYWRFEEALKRLENATGSVIGADGSVFAIRRWLHRPPPDHIIDDFYVSLMVLCQGYRVLQASDARGYEESVSSSAEEFRRKVRIACQAFNVHRLVWPQIAALDALSIYKYVSHKLIRWLVAYFLVMALAAFIAALLLAGHAAWVAIAAAVLVLGFVLGYFWAIRPFAQVLEVLVAFAGAGLGVWRSVRGERYQTWNPAASIRQKQAALR